MQTTTEDDPARTGEGADRGSIEAPRPMGNLLLQGVRAVNTKLEESFSPPHLGTMINSAQIRAGRGLLRWTQAALASRAALSAVTLNMIESDQVAPRSRTLDAIRRALEREGVRFVGDARDGFGVVLRPGGAEGG